MRICTMSQAYAMLCTTVLIGPVAAAQPAAQVGTLQAGSESFPQSSHCSTLEPARNPASWNGYGVDMANSRFQPGASAGIAGVDVAKLKLKWAFGFPGVTTSFGTPTV